MLELLHGGRIENGKAATAYIAAAVFLYADKGYLVLCANIINSRY